MKSWMTGTLAVLFSGWLAALNMGYRPYPISGEARHHTLVVIQSPSPFMARLTQKLVTMQDRLRNSNFGTGTIPEVSSTTVAPQHLLVTKSPMGTSLPSLAGARSHPWVLGYYTQYSPDSVTSQNSLAANLNIITDIAPLWYSYRANGSLETMGYDRAKVRAYARTRGIGVYPLVTNAGENDAILENASDRTTVVESLVQMAVQDNYPGYNIDFEGLNYWDRQGLSDFVIQLSRALHPLGKKVTVAVIPKTFTDPYGRAYDYQVLGQYASKVVLMTYDYHCIGSQPGPVAPLGWVTDAVNYALTKMPARKIVLGIAVYGYNWGSNGTTVEVHDEQAVNLAAMEGATINWDSTYQEPWFSYNQGQVQHIVWFENGYSDAFKIKLAQQDHLGGIAIWRLGDEDPHLWTVLHTMGY